MCPGKAVKRTSLQRKSRAGAGHSWVTKHRIPSVKTKTARIVFSATKKGQILKKKPGGEKKEQTHTEHQPFGG